MVATPGTIPALPPYQPDALPFTGGEALEIASSVTATSATSGRIFLTDLPKIAGALGNQNPTTDDLIAFMDKSTGLPFSCSIGALSIPTGNIPPGGATGQILAKNSGTNFDDNWFDITSFVSAGTSIFLTGSTTVAVGVATGGIGSTQMGGHAVQNAAIRQGAALSVIGVTGSAIADVADIVASGANQVLQVNGGGTGLVFGALSSTLLPGPFQASSFTTNRVLIGNGTSAIQVSGVATAALPLVGNGTTSPPGFAVLTVPGGGTNTTTLTAFGIPYGQGTSTIGITAAGTTAWPLVGNGTAIAPAFAVLTVPGGGTGTTILTAFGVLYGNGTSTVGISATGATALPLVSGGPTAAPAYAVLSVSGGGTNTTILTQNGIVFGNGTNTVGITAQGAAGTFLAGNGGTPTFTTAVSSFTTGFGLAGATIATTGLVAISTSAPPAGLEMPINLGITCSVAGGALTISLVQNSLATATAANPILIPFRDSTLATGDIAWRQITGTLTYTTPTSGATFGSANSAPFRLYLVLFDGGGVPLPAIINCSSGTAGGSSIYPLNEAIFGSSSAISGSATSLGTFYTNPGTTASSKPFRIVGVLDYGAGLATAGTYASTPTTLQVFGPGNKKPGDILQTQMFFTTASFTALNTTTFTSSIVLASITPTASPNLVEISVGGSLAQSNATAQFSRMQIVRGATQVGPIISSQGILANSPVPISLQWIDAPGTAAATTYTVQLASNQGSAIFPTNLQTASGAYMWLKELCA